MAPHSSALAWKTPWMQEPGRLQSMGSRRVGPDWATSLSLFTSMHWRSKWQPTPVFCLENPRDGGAWWAAVYGVAQSQTRLKRLSSSSIFDRSVEWPHHQMYAYKEICLISFLTDLNYFFPQITEDEAILLGFLYKYRQFFTLHISDEPVDCKYIFLSNFPLLYIGIYCCQTASLHFCEGLYVYACCLPTLRHRHTGTLTLPHEKRQCEKKIQDHNTILSIKWVSF